MRNIAVPKKEFLFYESICFLGESVKKEMESSIKVTHKTFRLLKGLL